MRQHAEADTVVRTAAFEDLDQLVSAYLAAFADEAVASWAGLISESGPTDPELFREQQRQAVANGEILVAERDETIIGVSVWVEADSGERFRREAVELGRIAAERPELLRTATVLELVASRHPDQPHLYLSSMAVHPDHRGSGVGGALLRFRLAQADAVGLPTHLEASTQQSQRLYERYGFRSVGSPLQVPDGGPRLQPMWRGGGIHQEMSG